jgi:hypothetical protein
MAALGSQSIASSYEQLLHVDADGGGNSTTHVSVKDGDNGTTFGFTIATDALMMSSTNRLEFGDTGTYIHQSADGVLDLVSDTELELNATTIDMNGAVDISGIVNFSSAGSAASPVLYLNGDTDTGIFQPAANGLAISIAGTERFSVKNDGNCVISRTVTCNPGDASFALKAYTSGTTVTDPIARFASNVTSSDTTHCLVLMDGDIENTNNSYGAISDERVKENITDANPQLDKLNEVKIRNFNRIGSDLKQIGVIAQELESVFPNLVAERMCDDGDPLEKGEMIKKVKMSVFVPIVMKAIQELSAKVEALEG